MAAETDQPSNDRPLGTWHLRSWQYVPEGAKERHLPPGPTPASGLGFLLPICSGEGVYFLGDLGRSRIKKYFLFKYEGGGTHLKKTRACTQEHGLHMLTKLRFHSV